MQFYRTPKVTRVYKPDRWSLGLRRASGLSRPARDRHLIAIYSAHWEAADSGSSSRDEGNSSKDEEELEKLIFLGNGDAVSLSQRSRKYVRPALDLSKEAVVAVQLEALANNHVPYRDQGIEVLYRFASIDPFTRSNYFGRSFDLGQFERFRRVMHTPPFAMLLGHERSTVLSSLQVSERLWRQRVLITGPEQGGQREEGVYEFTLSQRLGGCYDGYWFTDSITADGNEWECMGGGPTETRAA